MSRQLLAALVVLTVWSSTVAAQEECMDCMEKQVERTRANGDPYTEHTAMCCDYPCVGDGFVVEDWDVGAGCVVAPVASDSDSGTICNSGSWDYQCPERTGPGDQDPNYDDSGPDPDDAKQQSPIVLPLGDGSYHLTSVSAGVRFDIRGDGLAVRTAWTRQGSSTAFMALDRNANGIIDSGTELFGNNTRLVSGERAANGFVGLAELDSNLDEVIDLHDVAWKALLLWTDRNHDGRSTPDELQPVDGSVVTALETAHKFVGRRDRWGNTFRYMAHFRSAEGARAACYDVFFETE